VRFGKAARLQRRREFLAVQERGQRLYAGKLVVLALDAGGKRPRIGITVPGKVANAVIRNRIKRWVREAFRAVAADLPPVDLVVIARAGAGDVGLPGALEALGAARDRLARAGAR
jgi:ribonuclease P protein component